MERLKTMRPAASEHANRAQFDSLAANSNDHQIAPAAAKFHPPAEAAR